MRLKLDENLPDDVTDVLARRGHDVDTVLDEHLGGRKDSVVVRAATGENRMVVTLDRGGGGRHRRATFGGGPRAPGQGMVGA